MRSSHLLPSTSQRLNSVRLPAKAAVQLLTTLLVFSLCLFPNLAAAQSPHIYDAPQVGPPTTQAEVVGNGFDPNATLDLYFDSTDVGLVVTDNEGSFGLALKAPTIRQNGLTIQIPNDAVPGTHSITAVERITQLQAQVPFTVRTDWAQYHFGPDHAGYNPYENVLSPETVGNLTIRWKYTLGGQVFTSPTVANGIVYASGLNGDNRVHAIDASTGVLLWTYETGLSGSVAVANGLAYFSACPSFTNYFFAVNANSGAYVWSHPLLCGDSPAVANGVVYVGSPDNNVYALNASTGGLLWKYTTGNSVTIPAVANGVVYIGSQDHNLYALNASTGALLWKFATGGLILSGPAVANGVVYVGSFDNNLYALNASTGALIWSHTTNGFWLPAVANGVAYAVGGSSDPGLFAFDAATGVLLWKYVLQEASNTAPTVANGVVYFANDNGNGFDGAVYALDASTGALLLQYTIGTAGFQLSSPTIVNGMLYIGSEDGNLYALGLPDQQMSEKFRPPERPDPARLTPDWSLRANTAATPSKK